jgi:hypothetical protein
MKATDLLKNGEAAVAGHGDTEDDEVPGLPDQPDEGLIAVFGLARHEAPALLAEHLLQTITDQQMIVNNENRSLWHVPQTPRCEILQGVLPRIQDGGCDTDSAA